MTPTMADRINEVVSDTACCDRAGCRCWQAVADLKAIRDYCDTEIKKNLERYPDLGDLNDL